MAKTMKRSTIIIVFLFLVFFVANYYFEKSWLLSMAITLGTILYHFVMRLLVGYMYNKIMNNKADYTKKWYQLKPWEQKLYEFIKVKKWKKYMPTYDEKLFSIKEHAWDEIVGAMCQAELVHETIVILSFIPVLASIAFGEFPVFLITSLCAALFDAMFAIVQRYNRPRVVRVEEKCKRS